MLYPYVPERPDADACRPRAVRDEAEVSENDDVKVPQPGQNQAPFPPVVPIGVNHNEIAIEA
ncbi:hypothetical protein Mame01_12590 [Microbispora amethystogenes]|nr:hypothetical protein Mame01_12590 [Microbispora amethystogenes]